MTVIVTEHVHTQDREREREKWAVHFPVGYGR